MLPQPPLISRCRGCSRFFWVGRAERVGELEPSFYRSVESISVVTLEKVGKRRVEVMHLLRRVVGGNLQEVKARIDRLPLQVGQYFHPDEAKKLIARFEELGAQATLKETTTQVTRSSVPSEWNAAPDVEGPDEAGWFEAITEGLAQGPDDERELRLQAWWAGNEPYRRGAPWKSFSHRSQVARENLIALQALCSTAEPGQRLLRAEALRERERFEDARAVLAGDFPGALQWVAEFLRTLARQGISEVRRLQKSERGAVEGG
jgi:ribosomal protein L7/L12